MSNIVKRVLESNGVRVNDSDVDNVIFSNDKSDLFHLEISEGCFEDTRLLLAKLYDNADEFENAKELIDEDYFDERLYAIKETCTDAYCEIDLYSFVKAFFELINGIETKEELRDFLEDVNQDWLLQR